MYNSKICLKKKKVPARTCPLPFFLVILLDKSAVGGRGVSKLSFVLILQLEELCIAELSPGKVLSDIFKRKFFNLLNSTGVTFFLNKQFSQMIVYIVAYS